MVSSSVTPLACIADLDCDEIIRKRYFLKKQDCFGVKALVTFTKQLQFASICWIILPVYYHKISSLTQINGNMLPRIEFQFLK